MSLALRIAFALFFGVVAGVPLHSEDSDWWSRKPLLKSAVPAYGWGNNQVDSFILRKLKSNNLKPSESASSSVLIRRLTFDLNGLPPTRKKFEHSKGITPRTRGRLTKNWLTACLTLPATANDLLGIGWTPPSTRIPVGTTRISCVPMPGLIVTM